MEKNNKRKCGVCEIAHFERNNYFYGKLMTARDFKDEQCYFNEKRWLINRMIHGWGVVCGLDVRFESSKDDCKYECIIESSSCEKEKQYDIVIEKGLAIDCCGHEILVCDDQTISLADVEPPCSPAAEHSRQGRQKFVICLEYDECKTETVTLAPSMCSQSEKTNYNRIRDSFKIRLRHSSDVRIHGYQREFCQLSDRHRTWQDQIEKEHQDDNEPDCEQYETLHQYLCEKLREGCPDCITGGCLFLAEITVTPLNGEAGEFSQEGKQKEQQKKPQNPKIKIRIDPCSRRRLVYNNKMLFDLIHCHHDDLSHIVDISWKNYHGKEGVYWNEFVNEIILKGFVVAFDREMIPQTINRHTFVVAFKFKDRVSGTIVRKFIPAGEIEPSGNYCRYSFSVDKDWIDEEIDASKSELFDGIDVEIILRSSLIHDKNGKALDGDFINSRLPTGNGVQGGDFVSWFSVRSEDEKYPGGQVEKQEGIFEEST